VQHCWCQQARNLSQFLSQSDCQPMCCSLMRRGVGHPPCHTYIYSAPYTHHVFTLVTTYQLPMPSFAWVTDTVICCVCSLSVLITKGVFRGYLYVRHLSMTGMTGMTRNMESAGEYETAQKFTEKLSFLSLLSWKMLTGQRCVSLPCPYVSVVFRLSMSSAQPNTSQSYLSSSHSLER
jgi:hypothetical protein